MVINADFTSVLFYSHSLLLYSDVYRAVFGYDGAENYLGGFSACHTSVRLRKRQQQG